MIQSGELRERFLKFFEARSHTRVPSDGLIPSGDPTVLFTSAGMNQFKDYFLGRRTDLRRAASCQKCLRTGDLDNVGKTPSHHSFFEMLGNFSFGDYFKREAIQWGWEFLTGTNNFAGSQRSETPALCLPLKAGQLWVSIYEQDQDAATLWQQLGVPAERIVRFGPADNFWPANAPTAGPNGPCGPCSEIYFDPEGQVRGPKSVEIWNLVFTQFDRQSDGSLKPLPKPNIDTGMGLERLTRVMQGVETDYETDLFAPIVSAVKNASGPKAARAGDRAIIAQRAVADCVRALVFLISEGARPSNESRGYVVRMLTRRAYRLARTTLDIPLGGPGSGVGVLFRFVDAVVATMPSLPYGDELKKNRQIVQDVLQREEAQFEQTLQIGTARLEELITTLRRDGQQTIPGEEAFKLYDTYGFPIELTADIAQECQFTVDRDGFDSALAAQQKRSRDASQFTGGVFVTDALDVRAAIPGLPARDQQFVGYEALTTDTVVKGLWDGTRWIDQAAAGQSVGIVLAHSPFYGESGGQIGDTGAIESPSGVAEVSQTVWAHDVLVHQATIRHGLLKAQQPARASIDPRRRLQVARSHTATHLLHWALRTVLGPEAVQAGSAVEPERIRFDFSSLHGLHEEQRYQVEQLVSARVGLVDEVRTHQMPLDQAKQGGALALFGEKYGSIVRVVTIGDYSKELCGGTHVPHTGFVGSFLIVGESSIAAGTRRIEALVGEAAAERQARERRVLHAVAKRLGRQAEDVVAGLEQLLEQLKQAEQGRKLLQQQVARVQAQRLIADAKQINGIRLVSSVIQQADRELLTTLADAIRADLAQDGVVVLAASQGPATVAFVMATTDNLVKRVHAGQVLKAVAPLAKGSGGGRPEFAQAGGKDPAGIPAAMKRAEELIREAIK